jgi:hypothetical protein
LNRRWIPLRLRAVAACCSGAVLIAVELPGSAATAQESDRAVAAIHPDTVRVGEPFTLGISFRASPDAVVRFPAVLNTGEELEQLEASAAWHESSGSVWRAYYRLTAWITGVVQLPELSVTVVDYGSGARPAGREVILSTPAVTVASVLPADSAALSLRPARPPVPRRANSWLVALAILLALALLALVLRLVRAAARRPQPVPDPAESAREALMALRAGAAEGRLPIAVFYDGLELAVRTYLHRRRGCPPTRPVRALLDGEPGDALLAEVQERAGLVRFAGAAGVRAAALSDADKCLAWLEAAEDAGRSRP